MHDVLIVGGGPAGSVLGTLLARSGHDVVLVEGQEFPRFHVGESLLAQSTDLLTSLGVLAGDDSWYQVKRRATLDWGGQGEPWSIGMPGSGWALNVDRATFDDLLLAGARAAGVDVRHGMWAEEPVRSGARVCGLRLRNRRSTEVTPVTARFVVDASGLHGFLARTLGLPVEVAAGLSEVAIGRRYSGHLQGPSEAELFTAAGHDGWLWCMPLSDGVISAGLVTDGDLRSSPRDLLETEIRASDLIASLLDGAEPAPRVRLNRYANRVVGSPLWCDGYVLVGDAAFFVDPLLSTGVQSAFKSATAAASAICSILAGRLSEIEAAHWYDGYVRAHAERVLEAVRIMYASHPGESTYWRARAWPEGRRVSRRLGRERATFFLDLHRTGRLSLPAPVHADLLELELEPQAGAMDPAQPLHLPDPYGVQLGMSGDGRDVRRVVGIGAAADDPIEFTAAETAPVAGFLRSTPASVEEYLRLSRTDAKQELQLRRAVEALWGAGLLRADPSRSGREDVRRG